MKQLLCGILMLSMASGCATHFKKTPTMQVYGLRLHPGQDLKHELDAFAKANHLQAGFVITCVGSLRKIALRPANQKEPLLREAKFEIVSLTGTFSPDGSHLHISLSDSTGTTIGGHLLAGNEIYTTAEIVLGEADQLQFSRETDPETTFKELKIRNREKQH
jgi:predicted DNA-binding protein with PD1-like motif